MPLRIVARPSGGKAILLVKERRLDKALPMVEHLLKDKSEEVRRDAAECVGALRKGGKFPHKGLRTLLQDKSALVRAEAVDSIALIQDRGALPSIARLLSDKDPIVRAYAAGTIGQLGGSAYLNKIYSTLSKETDDLARVGMLEGLYLLGEDSVLPQLLGLLESADYHVRCSVANALEFLPLQASDTALAVAALAKASRKPLVIADGSTTKRVLESLQRPVK
jgi:HEAT repeat protein